ncbi:MAG: sensor histidine kinase [Steroidobacterales bacterium]
MAARSGIAACKEGFSTLHQFLSGNRAKLIERCRAKALLRSAPKATDEPLAYGIPLFLDQIIKTLAMEQTSEPMRSRRVSGRSGGGKSALSEIGITARRHGHELLRHGYTLERVVHDYGDLCQAITDVAFEDKLPIQVDEFRTLNRCLDNAIADAVTEFAYERDLLVADRDADAFHERLGVFAHELRNFITTASQAVGAIRTGQVGLSGRTGAVLDRCLIGLRNLVDRSLAEVRLRSAIPVRGRLVGLSDFIADLEVSARLEAQTHQCALTVSAVDARLAVDADRDMLFSAVGNLLQNAFKFTKPGTEVELNAYATADRILIDVEDHCGGLPPGDAERLFLPFTQSGADKSGVGLGLSICRRGVEANHGILRVRDLPGKGCVFTIDLPRYVFAATSVAV